MLSAIYLSFDYKVLRSDVFKRLTSLTDSYTSISPLTSIGKIFTSIMKDVTLQIILLTKAKLTNILLQTNLERRVIFALCQRFDRQMT